MEDEEEGHNVTKMSSVKLALAQLRPNNQTRSESKRVKIRSDSQVDDKPATIAATDVVENSIRDDFEELGIDVRLAQVMEETFHIHHLFKLQKHALTEILKRPDRDICISAPTGSGKTLMYLIPAINQLVSRRIVRLRCLVLVPSRELSLQVLSVAEHLSNAVGVTCTALQGEVSLRDESRKLVKELRRSNGGSRIESLIDVLIATPGRLLDHVEKTPGFTLEHLELLIVDEADKLLSQSYQDWLDRIYRAVSRGGDSLSTASQKTNEGEVTIPNQITVQQNPQLKTSAFSYMNQEVQRLRRILCSATLTNNPRKLAALALYQPILVDSNAVHSDSVVASSGSLSSSLVECEYKVSKRNKPLILLWVVNHLLKQDSNNRVLLFAASVERAGRVHSLLSHVLKDAGVKCALISSTQSQQERRDAIRNFQSRNVNVLVASDLAARGIDIPALEYVLNYDAPSSVTAMVHRAGRTARAGLPGTSITLLRQDEVAGFDALREKLGREPATLSEVTEEQFKPFLARFNEWHQAAGPEMEME